MLRTTLAGLRAHKLRLLLSAVAVILGVGFVSGTMTFSDTTKAALFDQFARSAQHVDAAVQPPAAPPGKDSQAPTLPESLLPTVRVVPGAAAVEGRMTGPATLLDKTGKPITNGSRTGIASDVPEDPRFRSFTLKSGRLPQDTGEALLDVDTTATHRFAVGDTLTPGT